MSSFLFTALWSNFMEVKNWSILLQSSDSSAINSSLTSLEKEADSAIPRLIPPEERPAPRVFGESPDLIWLISLDDLTELYFFLEAANCD